MVTKRPLSILLLGTQMAVGGAQRLLLDQAQWFVTQGHRVQTAFFYDRDGLYDRWQKENDFPVYDLQAFSTGLSFIPKVTALFSGLWRLWSIMRRERFDVVITYTQDSNTLGIPLAWLAGIPIRIGTYLGAIRGMAPLWRKIHAFIVNTGCMNRIVAASAGSR